MWRSLSLSSARLSTIHIFLASLSILRISNTSIAAETPVLGNIAYADSVVSFSPGGGAQAPYTTPDHALGAPDYVEGGSPEYVSLGSGGTLILHFSRAFLSPSGSSRADVSVFEIGDVAEATQLYVSKDGQTWLPASTDLDGNPNIQIGDQFQFVKLVDSGSNGSGSPYAGADIDAVALLTAGEVCEAGSAASCGELQCLCNEDYVGGRCVAKTVINTTVFEGSTFIVYPYDRNNQGRLCAGTPIGKEERQECSESASGSDDTREGNPVCTTTGAKEHYEKLFDGKGLGLPDVVLRYTSDWQKNRSQTYWTSSFDGAITPAVTTNGVASAYKYQRGRTTLYFGKNATSWQGNPAGRRWQLAQSGTDVTVTSPTGRKEKYRGGKLVEEISPSGAKTTYTWSGNNFVARSTFGKTISVEMDASYRISKFTDPAGKVYLLNYVNYQLSEIVYPDSTQTTTDNPRKKFLYADTRFPKFITGIIDENGQRQTLYTYNDQKQVIEEQWLGTGRKIAFEYFPRDEVAWSGDGDIDDAIPSIERAKMSVYDGTTLAHAYEKQFVRRNGLDLVVRKSDLYCNGCLLANETKNYSDGGLLSEAIDGRGVATQYSYDAAGRIVERLGASGTSTPKQELFVWSDRGLLTDRVVGDLTKHITYNADGKPTQITRTAIGPGQSRATTLTYYSNGLLQQVDGPRNDVGDITAFTYDASGNVITATDALGHVTMMTNYDGAGRVGKITSPNGLVTTLTYTPRGWLKTRTVGGLVTTYDYNKVGQLTRVTLPDGTFVAYEYDAAQRLVGITNTLGERIKYTLDYEGNRVKDEVKNASGQVVLQRSRVFNALNQLRQELNAANGVTASYAYDFNGNRTTISAPLGRSANRTYDALNRVNQITDAGNGVTQYHYDANDNLTAVIDPRNFTTSYGYDGLGDMTLLVSPDTGTTISTYDAAGNLKTKTDARGKTVTYGYDALNRVTQAVWPDQTISYGYDAGSNAIGRLTSVSDNSGQTSWTYDAHERVTSRQQTMGSVVKSVGYSYDAAGRLVTLTLPSGHSVQYGYTNGKVTSLTLDNTTTILNGVLYEPFGPTSGWTWGNNTYAVRTYDPDGNISQIDSGGEFYSYSLDNAFRITGLTNGSNSALSWSYGYDLLDRLTSASTSSTTLGWSFDANGNRLSQTGTNASTFSIASSSNRLSSVSGALTRTYTYDTVGNPTSDGTRMFVYNDAGRMVSVTSGGVTTNHLYNALGQRVKKSNASGTTYFVYDEVGHLVAELDGSGNVTAESIWMGNILVASLRPHAGGGIDLYYVHTDHLNAPINVTRPSDNAIVWRLDKDPYETVSPNENPSGLGTFHFNQRSSWGYYDSESGLIQNWKRDRDPLTGRFVQSDPIGLAGGLNTYAYANSNPMMFIDPLGLWCPDAVDVEDAGIDSVCPECVFLPALRPLRTLYNVLKAEKTLPPERNLGEAFPDRPLPRDKYGNPIPESEYAHTQLGRQTGRRGDYPQAREFDENGKPVRDIDFTDHGRGHPNPHEHRYIPNDTGGTPRRGPSTPLD